MSAAYLSRPLSAATQEAIGAIEAQRLIDQVRTGAVTPAHAWLRFSELTAAHGRGSAAGAAFIIELAKRAAGSVHEA